MHVHVKESIRTLVEDFMNKGSLWNRKILVEQLFFPYTVSARFLSGTC